MKNKRKKFGRMKKQVLFNIAIIALFVVLLNSSILLYPKSETETRSNVMQFGWIGLSSYAVIDNNPGFTSPITAEKNKPIELEPGKYYWCVPIFNSCLKKSSFEIQSEVSLAGRQISASAENATYLIENTGNVPLKIGIRNLLGKLITGFVVLEPKAADIVEVNETARIVVTEK